MFILTRVISLVSNDIVSDNRIHKIALSLIAHGYEFKIIGRRLRNSPAIPPRPYVTFRFHLWFNRGPFFYANLNICSFFYLLRSHFDIILSNDLDTLPACWLVARIRHKKLVFDSHELFPEVPELVHRPVIRKVWLMFERIFVTRLQIGITVSDSIAEYYKKNYHVQFEVIRNMSLFRNGADLMGIKKDNEISTILYQGVLNVGRGLELAIQSIRFVRYAKLQIIGNGDISEELKQLACKLGVEDKVEFIGRMPLEELWQYTAKAHIGLSLEEDLGLNYKFALPNKLFDYIQARLPVIVSDLPELRAIVTQFGIGNILYERTPEKLGEIITNMLTLEIPQGKYSDTLEHAAVELCWEKEEDKLIRIFTDVKTST